MKARLISSLKELIGEERMKAIRTSQIKKRNARFFQQKPVPVVVGRFEIEAPAKHLLLSIQEDQPERDLNIGVAAKFIAKKYPTGTIVDIGANIGDTAAIIATECNAPMILVEPSEYYFSYLTRNANKIPHVKRLVNAFVSGGEPVVGALVHWAGTAVIQENAASTEKADTIVLSQLAEGEEIRMVKLDTDGYDYRILSHSLDWLRRSKVAILLEVQIRTPSEHAEAATLFRNLGRVGYENFVVWDGPGRHILSTRDIGVVEDLNTYLLGVWQGRTVNGIWNYDVLCLHRDDSDVLGEIRDHYRRRANADGNEAG